mmetsp:Transcript_42420/g.47915  ORF Transcript_42420/g.47915 Transcript_42420/m.47915 type:complete len:567 (-) Transcript_42420:88-1788(-)
MKRNGATSRSSVPVGGDSKDISSLTIYSNSGNSNRSSSSSNCTNQTIYRSNNSRRRSDSKKMLIIRVLGGLFIFLLVIFYSLATRHFILQSAPSNFSSGGGKRNYINLGVETTINIGYQRVLYQPIIIVDPSDRVEQKTTTMIDQQSRTSSYSNKPLTVGFYFAVTDSDSYVGTEHLDPNRIQLYNDNTRRRIIREEFMTKSELKRQKALLNSRDYRHGEADTLQDMGEDCIAQYDWQEKMFPTCNHVMEIDMTNLNLADNKNNGDDLLFSAHSFSKLISAGYWRDVWSVKNLPRKQNEDIETFVLKSMRYTHDYVPRNYDRHRRDAVAMERLTSSAFVMDIYAACGNSGVFEYADGGSLSDSIWYNKHPKKNQDTWSPKERVVVAYQAVSGVADLHNFAKEGVPSIAHTDITAQQFVYVEEAGLYKLNDFNRARFLPVNKKTNEICTYEVGNNPGSFRSPEEYQYVPQTEKVDVYSFGNVLYSVLTGGYPFEKEKSKKAQKRIQAGERPEIPISIRNSTNPFDQTMLKAIDMCWIQDPKKRASARQIQEFITSELQRLGVKEDHQ